MVFVIESQLSVERITENAICSRCVLAVLQFFIHKGALLYRVNLWFSSQHCFVHITYCIF